MNVRIAHDDRDEIRRRAEADLPNLFTEHGGRRRGKALFCLFHENSNTPAASIHKGRFTCFACGLKLDVFGFIELAQRVDFKGALAYLGDRYGIRVHSDPLTEQDRREYAQRRAAAERKAVRLVAWRAQLLSHARDRRDIYLQAFHRTKRHVLHCAKQAECCAMAMDAGDRYEAIYQELDAQIATVATASWDQVARLWIETAGSAQPDVPMEHAA